MLSDILIIFVVLIPLLGFVLGGYYLLHLMQQDILDRQARRMRRSHTFHYDANGNPEIIRDAQTFELQIPPTGNSPFAPTIMIRDSIQRNIKADPERPMLYNIPQPSKASDGTKTIEQLETEALEAEISARPKLPISEGEKRLYIERCLEEGVKITRAAKEININPGEGKEYLAFKSLWASVVATKNNPHYLW
jgi:hypothetical protein